MSGTSFFRPGENCWRVEPAEDFSIIVDADDYFGAIRRTMMAAERLIFLVGSDFDAGTTRGHPPGTARELDAVLQSAVSPQVEASQTHFGTIGRQASFG